MTPTEFWQRQARFAAMFERSNQPVVIWTNASKEAQAKARRALKPIRVQFRPLPVWLKETG